MKRAVVILLGLALLAMVAVAVPIPDSSTPITPSPGWLIANGADQAVFTVTVRKASTPMAGVQVAFTVNDPEYVYMNPILVTSDANGLATSTFPG